MRRAARGLRLLPARKSREALEQRRVVAGGEHERRLGVDRGALEHRRRRRAPVLQRLPHSAARPCSSSPRGAPRSGSQFASVSGTLAPPGAPAARSRSTAAAVRARRAGGTRGPRRHLAPATSMLPRQVRERDEPRHHARVDVGVLELADQLEYLVGVVLDRGDPERETAVARAQAGLGREHLGVAGPRRGEHDPVLATAIAAKLDWCFRCAARSSPRPACSSPPPSWTARSST